MFEGAILKAQICLYIGYVLIPHPYRRLPQPVVQIGARLKFDSMCTLGLSHCTTRLVTVELYLCKKSIDLL